MSNTERGNGIGRSLFNFYMDRGHKPVENFQNFNRLMGLIAVVVCVSAGGPIGIGLSVLAAGLSITNEVLLSNLKRAVSDDHQRVVNDVYKSQDN